MNSTESGKWRYATKKFDSTKHLSAAAIDALEETFNLVPTSYGLQPVRLVVVSNPDLKNSLVEKCYGQAQVRDCSHVLVLATTTVDAGYIERYFELTMKLRNTAAEILAPFKKQLLATFEKMNADQNDAWARNQAYIALGMMMSACATAKIDSCPMEGFIPNQVDELLGLDKLGLKACLLLPVGYRAEDDMFATMAKVRLPLEEVITRLV
jgi:nitroreductase